MLVVAWADGRLGEGEGERLRDHARELPEHLKPWLNERLQRPPGPYFRYQVAHLLAFLRTVWPQSEKRDDTSWTEEAEEWAEEIIEGGGWLRRLFGRMSAEMQNLEALREAIEEGGIEVTERIWALARGAHAEAEPRRLIAVLEDHDQAGQLVGIVLEGQQLAVASYGTIVRDDDLDEQRVQRLLTNSSHLYEPERWILLAQEVMGRGRPLTDRQKQTLKLNMEKQIGGPFEECDFAEMAYLEDALAADARWVSWVPGQLEELHLDRVQVVRCRPPGTFKALRADIEAQLVAHDVEGPFGLAFRILAIQDEAGGSLRLATPRLTREPASKEAAAWIARFLPTMCDPFSQLVLEEEGGRWVAEVSSQMPCKPSMTQEPLPPGRALLVPPWVWFRTAMAMGVRVGRKPLALR